MVNTAVIGGVEYTISDSEDGVVNARYLSTGSMGMRPGTVCHGRAVGPTSNGFPGDYVISYYDVNGGHVGDYDWHIEQAGGSYRLSWRNREGNAFVPVPAGELVFEGFGFPNSDRSIVVAYWMVEKASAALRNRARNS